MTALAKRISETPMAPYLGVLQSMSREEKQIVMMFLNESIAAEKHDVPDIKVDLDKLPELPEKFLKLQGFASHTEEDIANDPRLAYILSK